MEEVVNNYFDFIFNKLKGNKELLSLVENNLFKYKVDDASIKKFPRVVIDEVYVNDASYADGDVYTQHRWYYVEIQAKTNQQKFEISNKIKSIFKEYYFTQHSLSRGDVEYGTIDRTTNAYSEYRLYKGIIKIDYKN